MGKSIMKLFPLFILITSCSCDEISDILTQFTPEVTKLKEFVDKINGSLSSSGINASESRAILLKMLDASAKIPNGILVGNAFDLGDFDECYGIQSGNIYGKYCLGTLPISLTMLLGRGVNFTKPRKIALLHPNERLLGLGGEYVGFHFGTCVLSTIAASEIPGPQNYSEEFCYSKATEPELSTGAVVTIVVLAIFGAIIVASTVFDIVLYYRKQKSPHELLLAFSFLTNGRKIFTYSKSSDQLLCLNGLKAISMMWVIIGHEFSLAANGPIANFLNLQEWENNVVNTIIIGATISVDTFFAIGGLVTVYTYMKAVKNGATFNIFLYWIHRIIRLTPPLVMACLIYMYLVQYFGNGPLWKAVDVVLVRSCKNAWWSTMLYISQFMNKGICVPQSWYLSVDMVLYFLSPIVLLPLSKWPKVGLGALSTLIFAGVIVPFTVGYSLNLSSSIFIEDERYMRLYYTQTYTRFGPYVIGMLGGYVIYNVRFGEWKLRLPPWMVGGLWVVSMGGLAACLWSVHYLQTSDVGDRWGNSLHFAFNRQSWALSLSGVIFLCTCGYGGPVDGFLSLPIFQFLTKVSYSMYLIHYAVITVRFAVMRNNFHFSNVYTMHHFWGDFIYTLVISVVFCLAFESPIIILEKYLFGRGTNKRRVDQRKPPA